MKQIASIGIIFLLIGLSILPSVSSTNIIITQVLGPSKTVIQVDDDGDGDYTSIQDAIDNATAGDTIEVYSGEYNELVRLDKQLTLVGISSELWGGGDTGKPLIIVEGDKKEIIKVTADYCSISGFHVKSTGYSSYGIFLFQSNNNNIYKNELEELNFGIYLRDASYNCVYDNYFWGENKMYYGIAINSHSSYNQFYDNIITGHGPGISLRGRGENNTVFNNTIHDLYSSGIILVEVYNNTINNNKIIDCGGGIGLSVEERNGNIVYGNTVSGCDGGISVIGKNHKVYHNDISYSRGIKIGGNHNKIFQNNIDHCKYGIILEIYDTMPPVHCYHNEVYENNVISSSDTGIWLYKAFNNDIHNNIITGWGNGIYGIYLDYSDENNIYENNISYNKNYGIKSFGSEYNYIYHNNIIGNKINAWCDGPPDSRFNIWNTEHNGGNYWSDYKGVDKNRDGVGDTPYVIPDEDYNPFNNLKDKYPLMEPDGRPIPRPRTLNSWIYDLFPILQKLLDFIL